MFLRVRIELVGAGVGRGAQTPCSAQAVGELILGQFEFPA